MGMSRSARGADLLPGADLVWGGERQISRGREADQTGGKAGRGLDQLRLK